MELIPYGIDDFSMRALAGIGAGDVKRHAPLPFPCAAFDISRPRMLRLNTAWYDTERLAEWGSRSDLDAAIGDYLQELCSPWDLDAHRFVRRYLRFIAGWMEENRDELAGRIAAFDGLYDVDDWLFSCPHPLPRAHVRAPADGETVLRNRSDYIKVPFAFLLDRGLVAAVADGGIAPRAREERTARLRRAGIEVVAFSGSDLSGDGRALFTRILGEDGLRFWTGQAVPMGLLTPQLLEI